MADRSIDVLMRVMVGGAALDAESMTEWSTAQDMLRADFTEGKFCEIQEFDFEVGVESSKGSDEEKEKPKPAGAPAANQAAAKPAPSKPATPAPPANGNGGRSSGKNADFIDMQPVEFTRLVDRMSIRLFQALAENETLDSISIVKRKAAGTRNSGAAYLRLDFTKVLLTKLDWKDSDNVILESGTFIYRKLTIRYRPQRPDGTLDSVIQSEWTMPAIVKS